MEKKILIIGAGPTGLGAAYRLAELGYRNWHIVEQHDYIGGLSASFRDAQGFTWDIGGHILFSGYDYFTQLVDRLLANRYLEHVRNSWIWVLNRFVPYPFQNNLRYLPKQALWECLNGLWETDQRHTDTPKNFREWIVRTFGHGIASYFMLPYNEKNWATPLELMSYEWIASRVSVVDFQRVLRNVVLEQDDTDWGPNRTFRFPRAGGTGAIYQAFLPTVHDHLTLNRKLTRIEPEQRRVTYTDGSVEDYDILINTTPLTEFVARIHPANPQLIESAEQLRTTGALVVGIGLAHQCPSTKCWMYFPGEESPFYRVTYFSNYSPENVPGPNYYSLMCETSYSAFKSVDRSSVIEETIRGLIATHLLSEADRSRIVSTFLIDAEYAYPVPSLERNQVLASIVPFLARMQIYTRGRFGLWLYEIGNMDHSVMQGVELVNRLLHDEQEKIIADFPFLTY
jgi:protoporphyrinogen oxidase